MKYTSRQIIGAILWWSEGTKAVRDKRWKNSWNYTVDFTNTNPEIIRSFVRFLRKDIIVDETRLRVQLQVHDGDDQESFEKYWSLVTGIPLSNFTKTIVRPTGNKIGKTKGTCKVRYSDKKTYLKIKTILEDILQNGD